MLSDQQNARSRGRFAGQAVLVTGAAGHLGATISLGIARDGGLPILNGRNASSLAALNGQLDAQGFLSRVMAVDVGDERRTKGLLQEIAAELAAAGLHLTGLVNNAFAGRSADSRSSLVELYAGAAGINLGATAHLIEVFAELAPRGSAVVNISSMYGQVSPDPALYPDDVEINPPHYGATKAGIEQLTRYYAVTLAARGIRVNSVSPGPFPKPDVVANHPEFARKLAERSPMKRLGEAHEVYPPIGFLLSADASYVTGANVKVDGGWTAI